MQTEKLKISIKNYISQNDFFPGRVIDLAKLQEIWKNKQPEMQREDRYLKDLIDMTLWTTNNHYEQELIYLTLAGRLNYACRLKYKPSSINSYHEHNNIELTYIVQGELTQKIDGKNVTFTEGEVCLLNSKVKHTEYMTPHDCTIIFLQINDIFLEKYMDDVNENDYTFSLKNWINQKRKKSLYIKFTPIDNGETAFSNTLFTIFHELSQNLPGKKRIVLGYAERILDLLIKEYHIQVTSSDKEEMHLALSKDICEYIAQYYATINVKEIAALYHYSADHINRIFAANMNMTLSMYIQKIRLERALDLLRSTTNSITDISRTIGYNNIGFFYKVFKEHYGVTPAEFRK